MIVALGVTNPRALTKWSMDISRLDNFLGYAESHRVRVCIVAAVLIAATAWADAQLPSMSIGFLYLLPILLAAPALSPGQIVALAAVCSVLREAYDPLEWSAGATGRILAALAGFAMTGFFVSEMNQRRRLLGRHLRELESEVARRQDAESKLRTLIETSPLAILTIDSAGRVQLANESAAQVLGFEEGSLSGVEVAAYLPILPRMLHSHHPGGNMRTNVECNATRKNGEVFLAHVWLSTYRTSSGPGLAAVIWDASENLRDREGAGLDSMLATSRVLVGAISHEIRNLAAAAASSYSALSTLEGTTGNRQYEALGSLIRALEKIASSGLQLASQRDAAVTDVGTLLNETRIVIEPFMREADIEVVWQLSPNLPLVQADHHSLLQVFLNLARNIRCVLEDCEERQLRITAGLERDLVVVRFYDTGPGVPHPEELFKPFQPGAHFAGLGLYISRAILRSHGGGLRYEPQPKGSCFAVELWPEENGIETDGQRSAVPSRAFSG
jgi:two-component system, LuxR family, sensor kinase FixL